MTNKQQYPKLKPPVWFIIFVSVSTLFSQTNIWPLLATPISNNHGISAYGGLAFLIGLAIMIYMDQFYKNQGERLDPAVESQQLLQHGPFLLSRNPTYVGMILAFLGLSLMLNSIVAMTMLLVFCLLLHFSVVIKEERYLQQQFGDDYQRYQQQVRRWL